MPAGSYAIVTRPGSLYHGANYGGPDVGFQPIFPILSMTPAGTVTTETPASYFHSGGGPGPELQTVSGPGGSTGSTGGGAGGSAGYEEWTGEEDRPVMAQEQTNWLGLALIVGALLLLKK